jgi:hypothetical protein
MNASEAVAIISKIKASWPRVPISRETAEAWTEAILDLDHETALAALRDLIRTSTFPPQPAELRAACVTVAHGERRSGGEAWGECLRLIRKHGSYRLPGADFPIADPLLARTIDALGWRDLCLSDNPVADRARFIETYESIDTSERRHAQLGDGARSSVLPERQLDARPMAKVLPLPRKP